MLAQIIGEKIKKKEIPEPTYPEQSHLALIEISESVEPNLILLLNRIYSILNKIDPNYAIGGSLVTNIYMQGRLNTYDLDIFIRNRRPQEIIEDLQKLKNVKLTSILEDMVYALSFEDLPGVEANFFFVAGKPEELSISFAKPQQLFNKTMRIIPLEFLIWNLLLSDSRKHKVILECLLGSGKVETENIVLYLKVAHDLFSLKKLNKIKDNLKYPPKNKSGKDKIPIWQIISIIKRFKEYGIYRAYNHIYGLYRITLATDHKGEAGFEKQIQEQFNLSPEEFIARFVPPIMETLEGELHLKAGKYAFVFQKNNMIVIANFLPFSFIGIKYQIPKCRLHDLCFLAALKGSSLKTKNEINKIIAEWLLHRYISEQEKLERAYYTIIDTDFGTEINIEGDEYIYGVAFKIVKINQENLDA